MITKHDVVIAMNILTGKQKLPYPDAKTKQVVQSLRVYRDRGELGSTVGSAIECLIQAGYEVE